MNLNQLLLYNNRQENANASNTLTLMPKYVKNSIKTSTRTRFQLTKFKIFEFLNFRNRNNDPQTHLLKTKQFSTTAKNSTIEILHFP